MTYMYFGILPYIALGLAISIGLIRYIKKGFSYSSLSSQFLEGKDLFFNSLLWHYGIIALFFGHLLGLLIPAQIRLFSSIPIRLYIMEGGALMFGFSCLIGIIGLIQRRMANPRIRSITSGMDMIILLLLFVQVILGVTIAIFYRWGSVWYLSSAVPYLRSLLIFKPDLTMILPLPIIIKLHIINAFLILGVFPFTRLVHMLVVPFNYLFRPYQLVIWNRNRRNRLISSAVTGR